MAQMDVETILTRQLASYLSVPVVLVSATGDLLYFNEPAEGILGLRFEETGRISREEAEGLIKLTDKAGVPVKQSSRPLYIALNERRPAHASHWLNRRSDGVCCKVEVTAFPLIGQRDQLIGAMAMFWKAADS